MQSNTTRAFAVGLLAAGLLLALAADGRADKPEFPDFKEVTKDMKVKEGFITLYHNEKTDELLARIPGGLLDKPFLLAGSIAKGPFFAGWQWDTRAVYFQRIGKQLVLMEADPRYKRGEGSTVADVIARTYQDYIVMAIPIKTMAGGDPVIDFDRLLKADPLQAAAVFGGRVDRELSRYATLKNFPDNTEIAVDTAVMQGRQEGQIAQVHYSFSRLPDGNGYQPRLADDRIGYFITAAKDWTAKHDADTTFERYIHRWQLRPAEPELPVSDVRPEDQIVFYIEKTVPVPYRHYVREGILEWNKAFEKVGLRNAVVVRQQTDTNEYADLDPEDVRYNFFRWIVSGQAFAMGPSRVNPYTGQILDADIICDDSYLRYMLHEQELLGPRADASFTDEPLEELLRYHPQFDDQPQSWTTAADDGQSWLHPYEHFQRQVDSPGSARALFGRCSQTCRCEIASGAARQLSLAGLASARAGGGKLSEEFIGQALKETVTHEVGHTLGLRHNYKASTWRTLDEIKQITPENPAPISASVMDYNAYVFAATPDEQGVFANSELGPWDYWVIEYGYRPFRAGGGEDAPKNEAEMLEQIACRIGEPGLDYATDEDTSMVYPDPTVNRWDIGADPLDFAMDRVALAERSWSTGLDWAVPDGDGYYRARQALDTLLGQYLQGTAYAARVIGGAYIHRDHKGDSTERLPIEPVPAERQRAVLDYLTSKVLSGESFHFSPELLGCLAPGRMRHWESDAYDSRLDYDVHGRVLAIQSRVLFQMLNPLTLNRLADAELLIPADQDALTLPELLQTVTGAIWTELDTVEAGHAYSNRQPMIGSFRRNLQRHFVQEGITMLLHGERFGLSADVRALTRLNLRRLEQRIGAVLADHAGQLDDYSRAHLTDTQRRLQKAFEAPYLAR